jgi:ATP-binding cassette subfamily B protein
MDQILVLHHGQLRESGTHQELLARRGIYYKLFELQYREELTSTPTAKLQTPKELTTTD